MRSLGEPLYTSSVYFTSLFFLIKNSILLVLQHVLEYARSFVFGANFCFIFIFIFYFLFFYFIFFNLGQATQFDVMSL